MLVNQNRIISLLY